jgi:proton-translocating NADH-quinone oxidoreductase chain L
MNLLVLFLPLSNFLIVSLYGWKLTLNDVYKIIIFNMLGTFCAAFSLFIDVSFNQTSYTLILSDWIISDLLNIKWGFYYDTLTTVMLMVVTSISTCVHIYAIEYMGADPHLKRFLSYLSFFTFFMLILVTANNLLQMFVGWEGVGLCSYLLINFWFNRLQANKAAIKAMLVNRVGDFGLAVGIFIIYKIVKSIDYTIFSIMSPELYNTTIIFLGYSFNALSLAAFFLFIGAVGKSAQLGLHTWLPDAMEGPTPVSALIHAATMVTAGIFLISRCSPLFQYTPDVNTIIILLGSFTAFMAGTTGLVQNDLKRVIAYSTCSQLGYMMFACGISNYFVSMFHLSNHAFFKAALFLGAGSVIHGLSDEQDMRKMGGVLYFMPFTFIVMLIGSFSLMGFPFLTGFYSKDAILELTAAYFTVESGLADWLGDFAAASTAFYSNRSLSRTFLNYPNGWKIVYEHSHESPFLMILPLFILSVGGFFIGYLCKDMMIGPGISFWGNSLYIKLENSIFFEAEFLDDFIKQLPLYFSLIGSIIPFYIYNYTDKWFNIRSFFFNIKKISIIRSFYTFLNRKWFFDKVYNEWINQNILIITYKHTYQNMDRGLLEFLGPNGIASFIYKYTLDIRRLNMSFTFHHIFVLLLSIFICIILIIYWTIYYYYFNIHLLIIFLFIIIFILKNY